MIDQAPGSRPTRPTYLLLGFVLAALVVLVSGILTYRAATEFALSSRDVQHAYSVLEGMQTIELRHSRTVSALRAYFISGDTRFRDDYRAAAGTIVPAIDAAIVAVRDTPDDQQALQALVQPMQRRLEVMAAAEIAFAKGGISAVLGLNRLVDVREPDEEILRLIAAAKHSHEQVLAQHILQDSSRLAQLRLTLGTFIASSLSLLMLFYVRTRRHLRQRELAELEVERQRRLADTIIENAPMGVYIKEAAGLTLVRVNRFVEEITGRSRQEMVGKDDGQFVGAEAAAALIQGERDLIQRRQMQSLDETQIETVRGRRTLQVRKVLIPDEAGAIRYLLGMSEDVTDRRRAEQGQRQFAETLERKSRELEAANTELESFSYSVSHDLRAPLRAVEGYAAILEEDYGAGLDDEGRRFLHNIREGATRMGQLIQDLLAFSRLGRQPLALTETDTQFIVQSAWDNLCAANPAQRAKLVILGDLPLSYGDPRLLQQAWTNLLENAVKYTSKVEEPRIQVAGETQGPEAVFSIQDNGVGFDMRYYDKLFKVFQRLHSESEYSGTGVGLAIVHRVIARHGGRVWARSEPGKGACFSFALPYQPGVPDTQEFRP